MSRNNLNLNSIQVGPEAGDCLGYGLVSHGLCVISPLTVPLFSGHLTVWAAVRSDLGLHGNFGVVLTVFT